MLKLLAYTLPLISLTSAIPFPQLSNVARTLQYQDLVPTRQNDHASSSKAGNRALDSNRLGPRQEGPSTITITEAIDTVVVTATVTETLNFIDPALRTAVAMETVYDSPQRLARQAEKTSRALQPRQAEGDAGGSSPQDGDEAVTVTVTASTTVTSTIRSTIFTTVTVAPSATTTEFITTTVTRSPEDGEEETPTEGGDDEDPEPTSPPGNGQDEEEDDGEEEGDSNDIPSESPEGTASEPSASQTGEAGATDPPGSSNSPQPSSSEATPTPSPSESSALSSDASTSDTTAFSSDSSSTSNPSSADSSGIPESSTPGAPAPTEDAMASSSGPALSQDELAALVSGILIIFILIVVLAIMCWSRRRGGASLMAESDREAGTMTPQTPFSALTGRSVAPSLAPLTRPQSAHSRGVSPDSDNDVLGRAAVISPGHPRWPTSGQIRIPIKPRPKRRTLSSELSPFGYTFPPIPEHDSDGNGNGSGNGQGRTFNDSTVGSRAVSGRLASREGSGHWQRPASISGAWLRYFRSDAPRFGDSSRSQSRSSSEKLTGNGSGPSSRASSRQGPVAESSAAPVSPLSPGVGKAV